MANVAADLAATDGSSSSPPARTWRAILLAVLAATAVALFAAHLPARMRLFVLLPMGVGAAVGAVVAGAGRSHGPSRHRVTLAAAVLVPLALAGFAAESYRVQRGEHAAYIAAHILAQPGGREILDRVRSGEPPANLFEAQYLSAYRGLMELTPTEYVTERMKGLTEPARPNAVSRRLAGVAGPPFAITVAAAEILLACVVGVWLARAMSAGEDRKGGSP